MQIGLTDMYYYYIKSLRQREADIKDRLVTLDNQVKYIYSILYPYGKALNEAGITFKFENEYRVDTTTTSYSEKKLSKVKINVVTISESLLKSYILAYSRAKLKLSNLYKVLSDVQSSYTSLRLYRFIIKSYNKKVAHRVLEGQVHTFGSTVGQLYIKRIRRIFTVHGKEATRGIDWGETKKLRAKLIEDNIPIYSKDNPNGEKYLVYYSGDYLYWFWWDKAQSRIPNLQLYTFTPTNFINTEDRSQLAFTKKAKSKKDIIESDLLGNRDKLQCLLRFDPSHGFNYVTDEREYISK